MIILLMALLLAPAVHAEESFERTAEDTIMRLARERAELLSPRITLPSLAADDVPPVVLRYSLETEKGRWEDLATMRMTRRTFDRYRELQRRWELDSTLRPRQELLRDDYFGSFGGRDAAAAVDLFFTSLAKDPRIEGHPWLEGTVDFILGTMELIDQIDNATFFDVFGLEVNDFMSDRLGNGRNRTGAPLIGPGGASNDGSFHGRLRVGISGLESVATDLDGDSLKLRAKYEIACPSGFIFDRVELGVESRPFCRNNDDSLRFYLGAKKTF